MSDQVVLLIGSPSHIGLSMVAQMLAQRGRCRHLFVTLEGFPTENRVYLGARPSDSSLMLGNGESLVFSDVVSVCMDGFYVSAEPLAGLDPIDIPYVQVETWATLIAMFEILSRRALVANFLTRPDLLATRFARLRYLATQGLTVPRVLVTSSPEAAREFCSQVGEVGFKPVADPGELFRRVEEAKWDQLPLCPVHFEELPTGSLGLCTVIGPQTFTMSEGEQPPAELQAACLRVTRSLNLEVAEFPLRRQERGWVVMGLREFPAPPSLDREDVATALLELLETGQSK